MTIKIQNKLLVPNAAAFMASFCIMVVELTAGRIIARYLGASLYTWTSVIGVVLAGIALGNYIGGRLADRFIPVKTVSILFILASISCSIVPVLNHLVGNLSILWILSWPVRIILHVAFIFLFPSIILGMIGPVVAKFALDKGLQTGQTVGSVYAWGAVGSVLGTFLTGFFLIAKMGTTGVIWSVAVILAIMGILFARKAWAPYLWAGVLAVLTVFNFGLREEAASSVIYETESQYSYIKVEHSPDSPQVRRLVLDQLLHSIVRIDESGSIENLYPYQQVYEAVTRAYSKDKDSLATLFIGGGGYVFPRYIEKHWPSSNIDVVEIDPAVTKAAIQAFGLSSETSIRQHHLDARNYIDNLIQENLRSRKAGEKITGFDFIYGDTFNGLSIPYQLTTYEFNEKIKTLLTPDGIYMINLIDSFSSGKFLGAVFNTLEKSFPYVCIYLPREGDFKAELSNTFIIAASLNEIDSKELVKSGFNGQEMETSWLDLLKEQSRNIILTDNFAPVENLVAPVVQQRETRRIADRFKARGDIAVKENNLKKAVKYFNKALKINPDSAQLHNNLANVLARQNELEEAISHYHQALGLNPDFSLAHSNLAVILAGQGKLDKAFSHYQKALDIDPDSAETHYNLGLILSALGKINESIEIYKKALQINPDLAQAHVSLGNIMDQRADYTQALKHYRAALTAQPDYAQAHNNIASVLIKQNKIEEAVSHYYKALELDPNYETARSNLNRIMNITRSPKEEGQLTEGI